MFCLFYFNLALAKSSPYNGAMADLEHSQAVSQLLSPEMTQQLEALGGQLVWRIGKDEGSEDLIVRVGFASATPRFAYLSRLRSANDTDLQVALSEQRIVIEWVD